MYRPNQYKPTPAQDSFSRQSNPMVFNLEHLSESISEYLPYVNLWAIFTICALVIAVKLRSDKLHQVSSENQTIVIKLVTTLLNGKNPQPGVPVQEGEYP